MAQRNTPQSDGKPRKQGALGWGLVGAAIVLGAALLSPLLADATPAEPQTKHKHEAPDAGQEIRAVLDAQVASWNHGDIDSFMDGYARSESTRFASGGTVVRGWQTVRDRYRERYDSREKMGRLTFSDLEVSVLSPSAALVFGRWRLERVGDSPSGLFTLQFATTNGGWRIVSDHTSSAESAPAAGGGG
jgi:ketosteroid isomerase-like protein